MAISFQDLLTDCLVALGDSSGAIWPRATRMASWCIEAIRTFPILRPMLDNHSVIGVGTLYSFSLPADFREVISVEYPINQDPPIYLVRKNRWDPDFYDHEGFYDVDHDYATGSGWYIYLSGGVTSGTRVYTYYLANHDTAMTDSPSSIVTVPEEYEGVLISSVMCRAYRERLSYAMQDPTAHTSVILHLTHMVENQEKHFQDLVNLAQHQLTNSLVSAHKTVDKFDRVY
jgi:hypothetical protein